MSTNSYDEALTLLLPPGPAWSRTEGSPGNAVLAAGAKQLERIDSQANLLVRETDPRTAIATFNDWLREYGLPDECLSGLDLNEEQLRQILMIKVRRMGLTKEFYKLIGAVFNVNIDVGQSEVFRVNSRVDQRVYGLDWSHAFVIIVDVHTDSIRYFFRANSRVNERLSFWGIDFFECLIRENIPAHAEVIFRYGDE